VLSAKVHRLLADLEALGVDDAGVPLKAVVFSQHRAAVRHLDFVLAHAGVPHVTICKGDQQQAQETAVATWTTRPQCRVFLLHAGAAAAGLTLIAARHLFLMEPFDKPGQELQALNRCHRIGQPHPVACTIYYARRTVEERLLAFRALEQHDGAAPPMINAVGASEADAAEAISVLAEGAALPSAQKLRFLFGMLRKAGGDAEGGDEEEGGEEEGEEAAEEAAEEADDEYVAGRDEEDEEDEDEDDRDGD